MAPILYMIETSTSTRAVLMVAKALGVEVNKHYLDITAGEHLTPEFLKLNPQHTVPTLVEEDGKVLWDGHAIIFYLVNNYGKDNFLYPNDPYVRAVIHQMFHFEAEYLFPPLSKIAKDLFYGNGKIDPSLLDKMKEAYGILEKLLEGHLWTVGNELTLADFSIISIITTMDMVLHIDAKTFPNIRGWIERVENLPYYKENVPGLRVFKKVLKKYLK